ncbi:MAG: exosortase E/protease, VPEID-CTERM system [Gammaproteobacteria bacterium]|nr:exosortase E/protease, VPEID-CTERM system [Gammaproteobacteria bacterium]
MAFHHAAAAAQVVSSPDKAVARARAGIGLGARVALAGGVLLLEKTFLNLFVDFDSAQAAQGLGAVVRIAQHAGFRFLVSFVIALAVFGYLRGGPRLQEADSAARAQPILRPRWLLAHLLLFLPLIPLSSSLYGHTVLLPFGVTVLLWLLLATLAVAALLACVAPWSLWRSAARALGRLWWYATVAAAGAALAMGGSQRLWDLMAGVTFNAVYPLLSRLIPHLQVDPENRVIDTGRFAVAIDPVCSGLEGMGLMLAFCSVWLLLFRREYILPRSLLLIPAGVLLSFVLNIVRIAALVLIGDAGYAGVAVYGFHSQAGWIAFNAAAVGIAFVSLRSSWFNRTAGEELRVPAAENPTALYLAPYMALLLAGMVSHAASAGFERLYWLRLVAVGLALAYSLRRLRNLDWRCSWRAAVAGLAVFALWIASARVLAPPTPIPAPLLGLALLPRLAWLAAHGLTSILAIPIAEELAFRGYLMRRITSPEFEELSPHAVREPAVIISAAVFGLCQGAFWLPGTIAGVVFGLLYRHTARLGESVAAHAVLNGLIAAAVLLGGQWQLW